MLVLPGSLSYGLSSILPSSVWQAHFNTQLAASGYDLDKWRRSKLNFAESELEILDANGEPLSMSPPSSIGIPSIETG
jgi:hypothetical protein